MKKWSEEEILFLKENCSENTTLYLSKKLNRSVSSVRNKLNELKLYKKDEFVNKNRSKRNKERGRDLNLKNIKKEAKKYKNKFQFQLSDPSAYRKALKEGFLDQVCSHMISYVSIPQLICKFIFNKILNEEGLYNDRTIINPYELDIYYPNNKIAIEYNGNRWHSFEDNTNLKEKLCKEKNIELIIIKENSRKYEEDIKNQICSKIDIINNISSNKISKEIINNIRVSDEIYESVLDIDKIKKIVSKYDSYNEFRKKEKKVHNKLSKLRLLNKYTKHMSRMRIRWDVEKVSDKINNYKYLKDFIKNENPCYQFIRRNKLSYMLSDLN